MHNIMSPPVGAYKTSSPVVTGLSSDLSPMEPPASAIPGPSGLGAFRASDTSTNLHDESYLSNHNRRNRNKITTSRNTSTLNQAAEEGTFLSEKMSNSTSQNSSKTNERTNRLLITEELVTYKHTTARDHHEYLHRWV